MPLPAPAALLLDFGGVIAESTRVSGWQDLAVDEFHRILGPRAHLLPDRDRVRLDIDAGDTAARAWRNAMARPAAPGELSHRQFIGEFIAADWPADSRGAVLDHATELAYAVVALQHERTVRPGMAALLSWCRDAGLPVAVVSNAQSGRVHRDVLERAGLSGLVVGQIYSDEHGVRKPNPRMIGLGAEATGVPVDRCWYVGDHYDRDVLCARRAGAGAAVLMASAHLAERPFRPPVEPDLAVADEIELLGVLRGYGAGVGRP